MYLQPVLSLTYWGLIKMTVSFDGNGFIPFDEVTLSTNATTVTIDINDDSNQNICLVTGSVGAATDNAFGRLQLLDSSSNAISSMKGNTGTIGVTTTTLQTSGTDFTTNYYGQGNLNSDSAVGGERMQLMLWIQASQNASEPYYDVHVKLFSTFTYTNGNAYQGQSGQYYQGIAVPRKLKFFWATGDISTASFKSYILGGN